MTRLELYYCDICHKEMNNGFYGGLQHWIEREYTTEVEHGTRSGVTSMELCWGCYDDIVQLINKKKRIEELETQNSKE